MRLSKTSGAIAVLLAAGCYDPDFRGSVTNQADGIGAFDVRFELARSNYVVKIDPPEDIEVPGSDQRFPSYVPVTYTSARSVRPDGDARKGDSGMETRFREPVILAADFSELVRWYCDALDFTVAKRFEDGFHYANLESASGMKIGIASAAEMGVEPANRGANTVVLQFQVEDLKEFFARLQAKGATITGGPSFNPDGSYWFGAFTDPEGNPFWVVDKNCP